METTETKSKLASALRTLQQNGDNEGVNRLVSAYKAKYRSGPVQQKDHGWAGNLISEGIKDVVARPLTNIYNIGETLAGKEATHPFSGSYLGDVKPIGEGFNALGRDENGIKTGEGMFSKNNVNAIKDSAGEGATIASYLGGGGAVKRGATSLAEGIVKPTLKSFAKNAVVQGGIPAAFGGLGSSLQNPDNTLGQNVKDTLTGGILGTLTAGALHGVGNLAEKSGLAGKIFGETANRLKRAETTAVENAPKTVEKVMNPLEKYSAKEGRTAYNGEAIQQKGWGPFKRDVLTPSNTGQQDVLEQMAKEGKIKGGNLPGENLNAINQEARITHAERRQILTDNPKLNNPHTNNEFQKAQSESINRAAKERAFEKGSSEENTYKDVFNIFNEEKANHPNSNIGLSDATEAFNKRMEGILGNKIYQDTVTGGLNTKGQVALQAAQDARKTAYDFIANKLNKTPGLNAKNTAGDLFTSKLQKEAQLLNAREQLKYKAGSIFNKSKGELWLKAHPKTINVAKKTAIGAAAVGGLKGLLSN